MMTEMKISKALQAAASAPPFKTADDVRAVIDTLEKAGLSFNPEDDVQDIVWSVPVTDKQKKLLSVIMFRLDVECDRFDLDIHAEILQSSVRVHGKDSVYWPDHRPYAQREWMCFWGEGYNTDGEVKHEIHGVKSFNTDNGYELRAIYDVLNLHVGETIDLTDPSGRHWVTRIK